MPIARIFVLAILFVTLLGCASAPPVPTGHFDSALSLKDTMLMLNTQAKNCWVKQVSPIRFGIHIKSYASSDGAFVISVHRVFWPEGIKTSPFAEIRVSGNLSNSVVDVTEGEIGCTIVSGCYKLGLAKHVKSWLSGDTQCFDFDKTLVHM